ncbi:MAG: N-acetyl-gamma-glutamyl-phosphate reductase [Candidatus Melainabacteria bacterium RIFOXYA12_FULL_32_12]|nr:MAG: N-acetyl-gamma-glutamyl-phosphate reductase [Candidatus Melainabacteria bacterium RIFOXYA12_FULL_32_12]
MVKAGIIGSTGYVGEELVRILLQHPEVELSCVTSQSYIGKHFEQVYENFRGVCALECQEEDIEALADKVDVIFIALPHGIASKKINSDILNKAKIIDIGADFRLKDKNTYESWYETDHHNEDLLNHAVYGLCEWKREQIKKTNLLANPGCYTTCSILSLAPLLKEDILKEDSIIIDAKSGVSGAGRSLSLGVHFNECNESIKAYKLASHRHIPEIEQELSDVSGKSIKITFTPHLVPMNRGILVTAYGTLKNNTNYDDIYSIYEKYYGNEYFIRLTKKNVFPETRWVKGSNYCDIGFAIDERTNRIIIVGALDNLVKGAAGQAVQNMNLMFGLEETMGLKNIPIFPV